jgi:hypothetical protein
MKTVQPIVTILLLFTYTSILFGCKKDDASSSSEELKLQDLETIKKEVVNMIASPRLEINHYSYSCK